MNAISLSAESADQQKPMSNTAASRLRNVLRHGGVLYAATYATRWAINGCLAFLDRRLVATEQRRGIVEPWCISARRWTSSENKQIWNTYDWGTLGEEWTRSEDWKSGLVSRYLLPNMPEGGTLLEIGPGGGRWTEFLRQRAKQLFVVDVSEKALQLCQERFAEADNISFLLGQGSTLRVPDCSIDAIWSYDVFVHINPVDVQGYFAEFRRVLKPGAKVVIHHPGAALPGGWSRKGWRSDLTDAMVWRFAQENGLQLLERTQEFVNAGDYLSVFQK